MASSGDVPICYRYAAADGLSSFFPPPLPPSRTRSPFPIHVARENLGRVDTRNAITGTTKPRTCAHAGRPADRFESFALRDRT